MRYNTLIIANWKKVAIIKCCAKFALCSFTLISAHQNFKFDLKGFLHVKLTFDML